MSTLDIFRNQALEANPNIVSIDTPVKELNISEPSWKEIQEVVKKARSGSAQAVYPIRYIDTAIQKGGIPGFSGCLEHTGVLSQMIRETKASNGNLTVVWLDLANAYGSIPHALIHAALDHYLIPQHIKGMIISYFGRIQLRFKTGHFTTQWQNLEKGIVTGCTNLPHPLHHGNEPHNSSCWEGSPRPKNAIRHPTTPDKRLHGRPYCDDHNQWGGEVGTNCSGPYGNVGENEV
ncbi:hypothetical protein ROHU_009462 [Labeo rohita]|uniref:Reverse transcriptase n=1 Tax=Labeo rohita TaxID=84645 RepID=A0A498LHG0_LABRO|nr:hypothetical protein ROHU_012871 [Labeo rohita]RXN13755.1 hypothetical protein ROHU_009462 [Labeo rohita]